MTGADLAVDISGLRKSYRKNLRSKPRPALDGLDLHIAAGGKVHGFLGPNGSGKTTTLRVLLGLIRADAGEVRLLGHRVPDRLPVAMPSVGSLIEEPKFFRPFTGRRNLELLADVASVPRARLDEVLETVGLADRADERVKGYSLGMRQRLGIAAALLKSPSLLILDEPSNGLDPAGIREIRTLMRTLADSGVTILVSSHLLAEVQQVCDEVTIISRGRVVRSGPVGEVLAPDGTAGRLRVGVENLSAATGILVAAGLSVRRDGTALIVEGAPRPADVTRLLAAQGLYLSELHAETVDLEDVFLALTDDSNDADIAEVPA
ncbi:MAG: type transport system ATP-binding protein [Frankiales bacterium]|jgi:ABC-2 type transport system ATP-binding protein|nr:type transport system ATP-binding protein [Frankiales bacterium]